MKPLRLLIVTFLLPLCLFGSNQQIFQLTNGLSYAEVPFTLIDNLIVVEAVIAGKRPLNFILDNGTFNTVIFQAEYIEGLSLPLGRRIAFRGAGVGKNVHATMIEEASLQLSEVATDRLGMVVLDENPFQDHSFGSLKVHGVLGATLFQSFVVEIDYPNRRLRFHQHHDFRPPPTFQPLPMKLVTGKPYLLASVQGKNVSLKASLMLDLGFSKPLLLQITDSLARKILTHRVVTQLGKGYSGAISGRLGRIDLVQIGNKQIAKVNTVAPFLQSYPPVYISPGTRRLGSVGNALFLDTSIIINYPDEMFYIRGEEAELAYTQ